MFFLIIPGDTWQTSGTNDTYIFNTHRYDQWKAWTAASVSILERQTKEKGFPAGSGTLVWASHKRDVISSLLLHWAPFTHASGAPRLFVKWSVLAYDHTHTWDHPIHTCVIIQYTHVWLSIHTCDYPTHTRDYLTHTWSHDTRTQMIPQYTHIYDYITHHYC